MSLLTEIFGLLDCWNTDRRKSGPAARGENLSGMPSDGMCLSASSWNVRFRPLDQTYKQDIRKERQVGESASPRLDVTPVSTQMGLKSRQVSCRGQSVNR